MLGINVIKYMNTYKSADNAYQAFVKDPDYFFWDKRKSSDARVEGLAIVK